MHIMSPQSSDEDILNSLDGHSFVVRNSSIFVVRNSNVYDENSFHIKYVKKTLEFIGNGDWLNELIKDRTENNNPIKLNKDEKKSLVLNTNLASLHNPVYIGKIVYPPSTLSAEDVLVFEAYAAFKNFDADVAKLIQYIERDTVDSSSQILASEAIKLRSEIEKLKEEIDSLEALQKKSAQVIDIAKRMKNISEIANNDKM